MQSYRTILALAYMLHYLVIFQTPKHVQDTFDFNTTSNPCGYLILFVSKTPSVV